MKKYLTISLITLVFVANSNCYATDNQNVSTIELVTYKEIEYATEMEKAFFSYVAQKAECVNQKQKPSNLCNRLTKFYAAEAAYHNAIEQYPNWQDKRLHWNSPKDHYLNFNSFKRDFQR